MIENRYLMQARQGNNQWWRYVLTLAIAIILTFAAQVIFYIPASLLVGTFDLSQMSPVTLLIVAMLPFGFLTLGLWFGLRYLHNRSFMSIINPSGRFNWERLLASGGLWLILLALGDIVSALVMPGSYAWIFQLGRFVPFLFVAVLLVPVQTSTEEFLFRGYLPQGLGLLSKGFLLPWIVPAVLFGLLHGLNPEVTTYGFWIMMVYYIGFGLLLGWITLRSRSLEMSMGLHLANNLYSALAVTYPSAALQTPAVFTMKEFNPLSGLLVFGLTAGIYLLVFTPKFRRWNEIGV